MQNQRWGDMQYMLKNGSQIKLIEVEINTQKSQHKFYEVYISMYRGKADDKN